MAVALSLTSTLLCCMCFVGCVSLSLIIHSDMSLCIWDIAAENALSHQYDQHTEFVIGMDFNMFIENQIASCSWDQYVCVWEIGQKPVLK
jgi:WD40 repeat protein